MISGRCSFQKKLCAALLPYVVSFTAASAIINTGSSVLVIDRDSDTVYENISVGPGDTDVGAGLGYFFHNTHPLGSSLTVTNGSKLTGGYLVTLSDSTASPAVVTVDGAGSQIKLLVNDSQGQRPVDIASQHYGRLLIKNGGTFILEDDGSCSIGECFIGNIANASGSRAHVTVTGTNSIMDLTVSETQGLIIGQGGLIPAENFGTVGGHTSAEVHILDGGVLNTPYTTVGLGNSNDVYSGYIGSETVDAKIIVSGEGSIWNSETIVLGLNEESDTPIATATGSVYVTDKGLVSTDYLAIFDGGTLGGNAVVEGDIGVFGGVITGDLSIMGNVEMFDGLMAPGASPGMLDVNGDFIMHGGRFQVDVNGTTSGLFDMINASGLINILGGEILFNFNMDNYTPSFGDVFQFLQAGEGVNVSEDVTFAFNGLEQQIAFEIDRERGYFRVLEDASAAVPEPSTFMFFITLLLGMVLKKFVAIRAAGQVHASA